MATFGIFDGDGLAGLIEKMKGREQLVKQELSKAINKAAREVVNLSSAEWNSFFTAKDYTKGRLDIVSGATPDRPFARINARSRATRANRFKYSALPDRGGVHLNVRRGSPGAAIKNAFVVNAKSDGRPLIIERLKKYQKGEGRGFGGKKFKALYGPSVNQFFYDSRERVGPEAVSAAKQQFLRAIGQ